MAIRSAFPAASALEMRPAPSMSTFDKSANADAAKRSRRMGSRFTPSFQQEPYPYIWLHIERHVIGDPALNAGMKALIGIMLGLLMAVAAPANAQTRSFSQPELDALLAPVALYPDPLLSQVLMAATYPQDVAEAAAWSRANPYVKGEDAVRAAQGYPWDPSVKSLLAFPDILARMDESPQWT